MEKTDFLIVNPKKNRVGTIVLAHGAGAPMDSEFMNVMAEGLAGHQFRVVRFEFPYMAQRRETGKSKPPSRAPVLIEFWQKVIESLGPERLVIGGKSMGGRIASMVADTIGAGEAGVAGVACLGYPFHPTGKPDKLRIDHLQDIQTPVLVVQGERDAFGTREEVDGYPLGRNVQIHWLPDGDHSFKPRKSSGKSLADNMDDAIAAVAEFAGSVLT